MSRKDILKKSLGITEYPWSSDEEENGSSQTTPEVLRREQAYESSRQSVADAPGTSGSTPSSVSPTRLRREQARVDRDVFWSLVNHPSRIQSASGLSRSRTSEAPTYPSSSRNREPEADARDSNNERSMSSNIQRLLAFRKLTRSLSGNRQAKCTLNLYPARVTGSGSSRSLVFMPMSSTPAAVATLKSRRQHGNNNALNNYSASTSSGYRSLSDVYSLMGSSRYGRDREQSNSSTNEPVVNLDHTDDETERAEPGAAEEPAAAESNGDQENNEVEETTPASSTGVRLEEEIVEIDPDTSAAAEEPVAAADESTDTVAEATVDVNDGAEESEQPHGVKRKRSADEDSEPYTVKDFNQNLLRLLECPVCLEWMEPPMWQCRRGHLVCGRCRARLAACPVCRTAFSSVRNRAMEGVAEMVRYPCRHGCGGEVRLRRRNAHEASCHLRRYRCPAPPCQQRPALPSDQLHAHLQNKHPSMLKVGKKHKFSVRVNSELHDNWVVVAMHALFHVRVDVDIRTWGVVVYAAYIGPKCNATDYRYQVVLQGRHNSRKLVYERQTHSDLESSNFNVSRQDCFHLTLDQALNFLRFKNRHCEPDKYLDFTVEINKDEHVDENRSDSD